MSKSNAMETDLLELLFNATAWPDLAEDDSTSPATNLYVSLHTGDPGEAGNQSTSEATYGSYARVAVARTSGGWTVASGAVTNAAAIVFPECTSGSNTITHFGVGTASSGAGYLLYSGALTASLAVSTGIEPQFAAGDLDISED
jgi:hypothetical protein